MIERDDTSGIAVVRLAHGKVNALDLDLVRAIAATFTELDRDESRAVVLTGSGRAFSAGVDLVRITEGGADYVREFLPALVDAFLAVFRCGKPVVAAANGHAIAGGAVLVAATDQRYMSGGRIGVTELLVGVPFPVAALEIVTYALGAPRIRTAVLTGETYGPEAAREVGWVDAVVDEAELLDVAVAAARSLAETVPADTYRHTKAQLHRDVDERIARWSPDGDAEAAKLWQAGVADGRIARFLTDVVGRRG
jgi:enoyl-CoA hydratase